MMYLHIVTNILSLGLITAVAAQPFESAPAAAAPAHKEAKCVDKLPEVCERKPAVRLVCLTGKWWCEWPEKVYQTPVWWPIPNSCDCKEGDLDGPKDDDE